MKDETTDTERRAAPYSIDDPDPEDHAHSLVLDAQASHKNYTNETNDRRPT
jgi:hypothetical protein